MNIKKLVTSLLAVAMILSALLCFCACAEKPEEPTEDDKTPAAETSIFAISYKNTVLELGKDASGVLKKLGDPSSEPKHVASCGENMGEQWQYTYPSIVVFTLKNGDKETIDAVALRDDIAETSKGITVGSTEVEMIEAYGEPTRQGNKCLYQKDSYTLEIRLDDAGVVAALEIRAES